jgi:hypothetical protein
LLSGLLGILKSIGIGASKSENWWPNVMNKVLLKNASERQRKSLSLHINDENHRRQHCHIKQTKCLQIPQQYYDYTKKSGHYRAGCRCRSASPLWGVELII